MEIDQIQEVGTHTILICRVVAIQQSEQEQSLVYFNRAYHQVRKRSCLKVEFDLLLLKQYTDEIKVQVRRMNRSDLRHHLMRFAVSLSISYNLIGY